MNDPYTARQHRNLARAQREYEDRVPEDEECDHDRRPSGRAKDGTHFAKCRRCGAEDEQ